MARKKTGGRKKGSLNKRTIAMADLRDRLMKRKMTPLEFMMKAMLTPIRGAKTLEQRLAIKQFQLKAAADAAPYLHPKLATIEHKGSVDANLNATVTGHVTMDVNDPGLLEAARRIAFVMAMGARMAQKQEKLVSPAE